MSLALLQNSHGTRPEVIIDDLFPDGILALDFAAEAGTLLVGSAAGHLTLLQQSGDIQGTERNYSGLERLAWADAGNYGAAVLHQDTLVCFSRTLRPIWDVRITGRITAVAMAPHGGHLAFSTDGCRTFVVSVDKQEISQFDTWRPVDHLAFLAEEPVLVGASEYGGLCCFRLDGTEIWTENIVHNIGDISVSGCGRRILLSAFNHGIQLYNRAGRQRGSFMLDGIPSHVSGAATRTRLAAITLENRVYWLNFDGEVHWVADLSADPPRAVCTGPLGDRLFLATASGRLLQLAWP